MSIALRSSIRGVLAVSVLALAGCGGTARLPLEAGMGPNPQIPPPEKSLLPTIYVAPAKGWPPGGKPVPGAGLTSVPAHLNNEGEADAS